MKPEVCAHAVSASTPVCTCDYGVVCLKQQLQAGEATRDMPQGWGRNWWGRALTLRTLASLLGSQRSQEKLGEHIQAGGRELGPGERTVWCQRTEMAAWNGATATELLTSLYLCYLDY